MPFGGVFKNIKTIVAKNKLVAILIFAGIFLRFFRLGEFTMFLGDQGRDAIIIKRILSLEHFPAIGAPSSVGQVFLGPFYYYLMSPFLALFRLDPAGLAFGVALISSLGLIISYQIVKGQIDRKTALLFLFLLVFSYVNVESSRFSWNPNLLPLFSFLTLYFFYKLFTTRKNHFAILSGAFLSLSIQLHHLAFFLIFPLILVILQKLFYDKSKSELLKKLFLSFIGFLLCSAPLIIFDLKHDFLNTKSFIKLFTTPNFVSKTSYLSRFFETVQSFFAHFFSFSFSDSVSVALFVIFIFAYLFLVRRQKINLFLQIHFLNILFFILVFSFLNTQRLAHYYGVIYFSFFVVVSYLLVLLSQRSVLFFFLLIPFLALYLFFNARNYYFLQGRGENQIQKARLVAQSIIQREPQIPYQVVALPFTETDGHIRYFLEVLGKRPLPEDSNDQPQQLYVLCYLQRCDVLGDPQWQIAAFSHKKIDTIWQVFGITIYQIVHEK